MDVVDTHSNMRAQLMYFQKRKLFELPFSLRSLRIAAITVACIGGLIGVARGEEASVLENAKLSTKGFDAALCVNEQALTDGNFKTYVG